MGDAEATLSRFPMISSCKPCSQSLVFGRIFTALPFTCEDREAACEGAQTSDPLTPKCFSLQRMRRKPGPPSLLPRKAEGLDLRQAQHSSRLARRKVELSLFIPRELKTRILSKRKLPMSCTSQTTCSEEKAHNTPVGGRERRQTQ